MSSVKEQEMTKEELTVHEREAEAVLLVEGAFEEMRRKYGFGGEDPKPYHNDEHARDVTEAGIQIADMALKAGRIEADGRALVPLSTSCHDIEQNLGSGYNEIACAEYAEERMKAAGIYSAEDIAKVKKMIRATEVYFVDGVLRQCVDTSDYLSKIMADADLASSGKSPAIYWDRALRLLREQSGLAEVPAETVAHFAVAQQTFLRGHFFFTEEAAALFPHKQENIEFSGLMAECYTAKALGSAALLS